MQIPSANISAYRRPYQNGNQQVQTLVSLRNQNIRNQRQIGSYYALVSGTEDEGAFYRGYGSYFSNAAYQSDNIYDPIYYNRKSIGQSGNSWFI